MPKIRDQKRGNGKMATFGPNRLGIKMVNPNDPAYLNAMNWVTADSFNSQESNNSNNGSETHCKCSESSCGHPKRSNKQRSNGSTNQSKD